MSQHTLVLSSPCYVSKNLDQILLTKPNSSLGKEEKASRSPTDLAVIIIENPQCTITLGAMQLITEHKIVLIICDEKHLPSGIMLPFIGHTLQGKHQKVQLEKIGKLSGKLWQQIISAKINNQLQIGKSRNWINLRMERLASSVQIMDKGNHEAQASRLYFEAVFPDGFVRNEEGGYENILLNYGYSLLRAAMARALVGAGLMLNPGVFHKNQYNPFPLADDMMEPFRPLIDGIVLEIVDSETMESEPFELTPAHKRALLGVFQLNVLINERQRELHLAMQQTASSLVHFLLGNTNKLDLPTLLSNGTRPI